MTFIHFQLLAISNEFRERFEIKLSKSNLVYSAFHVWMNRDTKYNVVVFARLQRHISITVMRSNLKAVAGNDLFVLSVQHNQRS